jgi:hypothetical protein
MSFLSAIKNFFVSTPKQESTVESAPYKIPEPAATTPIPLVAEVAPAVVEKKKPAAKKPAVAKAVARKPRAPKV